MHPDVAKVAVLIPCYNEELTIGKVIDDFRKLFPEADIYVFDNNSTDRTHEIAVEKGVTVIKEKRQGKGYVIQAMFRKIDAEYYIMVDGDDTYPSEKAPVLLDTLIEHQVDMVVGSRLQVYEDRAFRPFHVFGNKLVRFLVNKLFRTNLKDIMSGFRVMNRDLVKNIVLKAKGFEVETELTLQCLNKGYSIKEVDIPYKERPSGSVSKLNTFSDGYRILKEIFIICKDYRPLLFFGLTGIVTFFVGIISGGVVVQEFIQTRYITHVPLAIFSVGSVLFSIIMFAIGLTLDVIHGRFNEIYSLLTNVDRKPK
jgi:glycosyltransferase involved in cell wall biosynthesis